MAKEIDLSGDPSVEAAATSKKFLDEINSPATANAVTDATEKVFGKAAEATKEKEPPPLTRTESHLLRGLARALHDANPTAVEELLGALAEHPNSVRRVLGDLKKIFEKADEAKNLTVSWEQGTNSNNEPFVRLRLSKPDSADTRMNVVIGSDGQHQSVRRTNETGAMELVPLESGLQRVRPEEGRSQISVKKELLRQATERNRGQD